MSASAPPSHGIAASCPTPAAVSRRAFLARTALAGAAASFPVFAPTWRAAAATPPSERITVALIGRGAMGAGHLQRLAHDPGFHLVAVCDADRSRREEGRETANAIYAAARTSGQYAGCQACNDYREILARDDIDAVLIATPDHWHTLQTVEAVKAGKDVYCEKPVSVTLEEGRRLVSAVRRYQRVFQTGTQYRSAPAIRTVCRFIREGGLGRIKSVFTLLQPLGSFMNWRFKDQAQAERWRNSTTSPVPLDFALPAEPVPADLDWNLWVGPAPWRNYNHLYHSNPSTGVVPWSFDSAFGVASSTWFLSHAADVIQWALGVERSGPVEILHPASAAYPTLTCRYASGTLLHFVENWDDVKKLYGAVPQKARVAGNFGGLFVGERGWLTTMYGGGQFEGEPESLFEEMKLVRTPEVNIGGNTHHANWLECIRTRGQCSADEEIGHRSASLWHLLSASLTLNQSLQWDPVREVFSNPWANRLLSRATRAPWHL
jgi:hypothetical protein